MGAIRATVRFAVQSRPVPHISFERGNSARYGECLICCGWDKLLAALVENKMAHYFGPSFPPMYHLDTTPGSYIPYTQLQRPNDVLQDPPVIGAHRKERSSSLPTLYRSSDITQTTLNSVGLELSPTPTRYVSQPTRAHLHDRLDCAAQDSYRPPRNGTSLYRRKYNAPPFPPIHSNYVPTHRRQQYVVQ